MIRRWRARGSYSTSKERKNGWMLRALSWHGVCVFGNFSLFRGPWFLPRYHWSDGAFFASGVVSRSDPIRSVETDTIRTIYLPSIVTQASLCCRARARASTNTPAIRERYGNDDARRWDRARGKEPKDSFFSFDFPPLSPRSPIRATRCYYYCYDYCFRITPFTSTITDRSPSE